MRAMNKGFVFHEGCFGQRVADDGILEGPEGLDVYWRIYDHGDAG